MTAGDGRFGLPSERRAELTGEALGAELLAGAEVTSDAFRRSQRLAFAVRGLVFAAGFALALTFGLGWVLLALAAVAHHFLYRTRQALVATDTGLHLVTSGPRSTHRQRHWTARPSAQLTLRPGNPTIEIELDDWVGQTTGLDLDNVEATIRAAGGEPLRVIDRS
ncbi:MAG: hypothetical protein P8N02_03535 [Actinomycetota bacterium]|nr:hypothetical protein [Actinomycetota bacterium]